MKTTLFKACTIIMIATSSFSYADDFEGSFVQPGTNIAFSIKKIAEDQYSISNSEWEGVAYFDKNTKTYKGLYRYLNKVKIGEADANNAVGFHEYKINPDKTITVSVLATTESNKHHTYSLNKLK